MSTTNYEHSISKYLLISNLLLLSVLFSGIQAQAPPTPDSLLSILKDTNTDEMLRIKTYEDIIVYHSEQNNNEQILDYLGLLKIYSEDHSSQQGLLKHSLLSGRHQESKGNWLESMGAYNVGLSISEEIGDKSSESILLSAIAKSYARIGQTDTARIISGHAVDVSHISNDAEAVVSSLLASGQIEQMAGNYAQALDYYILVDSIFRSSEYYDSNQHGNILVNMGLIYDGLLDDVDKAKEYLTQAINLTPRVSDRVYFEIIGRIGNLWLKESKFYEADSLLQIAIDGLTKLDTGRSLAVSTMYYGESKIKQGDDATGLKLLLSAKKIFDSISDQRGQGFVNQILAHYYLKTGQLDKSEYYTKEVLKIQTSHAQRLQPLKRVAVVFAKQGKYSEAFDSLMIHTALLDSLYENEYQASLNELEKKFQTAQKEKEIADLKLGQSIQESKNQKITLWSIIGSILLLTTSLFYYLRFRQNKLRNSQLTELDNLKSKLFSDISHEFRTPLSLISSPVEVIASKVKDPASIQQELDIVRRNTNKLNRLVDSVQNLSQLDTGKLKLQIKQCTLPDHLSIIGASFESTAVIKNLSLTLDLELPEKDYYYDPNHLETIMYNLLSNAIKFTNAGGVRIEAHQLDGQSVISVSDTGQGLSPIEQTKIFNRYHRVNTLKHSVEGVGIGLALTHELTKLHHGQIAVHSEINMGSKFTVTIPTSSAFYKSKGLSIGSRVMPEIKNSGMTPTENLAGSEIVDSDLPLILIVEDNLDMSQHLTSLFVSDYSILLAHDGEEGIKKAIDEIPDIIISDLMMPVMDGQTFLKAVKNDPKTSHIPFVMLTANHLEQEKLKGLEQRVDDYLTKPFSIDELKLKVKNLIQVREQLKSKYQNSKVEGVPDLPTINETEQRFWVQLNEVVQENLSNAHFSADDFAKSMFMSRMQLHRKLKALTGMSSSIYIRNERLKVAHKMLSSNDLSIANVAYEVGFTSPSYFSHSFKEKYGIQPKVILNSKKQDALKTE